MEPKWDLGRSITKSITTGSWPKYDVINFAYASIFPRSDEWQINLKCKL